MERLTERTSDGILVKEGYGENVLRTLYQCYGAEPLSHYENCDEGYCAMERLADYEVLEEKGFLLKLPCKVGDVVYRISTNLHTRIKKIEKTKISRIAIDESGIVFFCKCNPISKCVLGKTVFLTQAEAGEALNGMKSEGGYV